LQKRNRFRQVEDLPRIGVPEASVKWSRLSETAKGAAARKVQV
jgi:hypothetical protein